MDRISRTKRYPKAKQIYISDEVWKKAGEVLREVGISRSSYIEITLRHLVRLDSEPSKKVYNDVMEDLWSAAKDKTLKKVEAIEEEIVKKKRGRPKKQGAE